ncbi:YSC84-related protein [Alishewanella sp. HH-ZS]|uniref:lipid-binding SYLF domain-containing protein n=1 Tax=Alishewanella sp. HH-ZS TaxID=1856684 RepID=UPI0008237436|nr:YSC84-related protein [Alishewanella sp. HH-ZS]OCW97885.1 hypothetical protein A9165_04360 [Alishewanella sp. HH-ZS]
MWIKTALLTVLLFMLQGCAAGLNATPAEQRTAINEMRQQVLTELYREKASARPEVASAPGYAVFSNANVNLLLASFGGGYGVVRNNRSGADIYMRMGEVGVGLGAGVKDFRLVMVFHTEQAMNRFIEQGWAFGAQADAAAKAGDKGAAVGAEASVDEVTIYQFTEAGLALQATIKGTKFWVDRKLN